MPAAAAIAVALAASSFSTRSIQLDRSNFGKRSSQPCIRPVSGVRAPAMQLQLNSALEALDVFYRTAPYVASFVTCGFKAACSDAIAQRSENASSIDFRRNLAFVLYGGGYQGCFQYFVFNKVFPVMFGEGTDVLTVTLKVVFDQLVLTPFLCLPCAYLVKALIFAYPLREGLDRYVADARRDLLWKYWLIWTPTQCLTFSVVPEYLRIAFIAFVSFFWLIILSSISNRREASPTDTSIASPKLE